MPAKHKAPRRNSRSGTAAPVTPRSKRHLPADGVIDSGKRRADRRDWLSIMEDGHPERRPIRNA